jgi:four helix bundle protein
MAPTTNWIPGPFDYERLEVTTVARETLRRVTKLARSLPRGNGSLRDQMTRAIESAWLQGAEGASRRGADAKCKFQGAYAECGEAAAAVEAAVIRELVDVQEATEIRVELARQCAMLRGLAR